MKAQTSPRLKGSFFRVAVLTGQVAGGLLPQEEWERRLVDHYLRSDGPYGGAALNWLDATPAELATAIGREDLSEDEVQRAFLMHFDRRRIHDWLSGARRPALHDAPYPTYFRYLVLTCLVSATDAGAGSTHNFRARLGQLLGLEDQYNSVSGVNALWRELVRWSDRKRALGEQFRKIVLPSYGNANLIGYAVRIAFPSWRDRSSLTQVMRDLSPDVRRSPERLSQALTRQRNRERLTDPVLDALDEFERAVRCRQRMLLGHKFWRLSRSVETKLYGQEKGPTRERWRLEVRFGGYEQDIAQLSLFRGSGVVDENPSWEGALQELGTVRPGEVPRELAEMLTQGVLVLTEEPGLVWMLDDQSPPDDVRAVVVARSDSFAMSWPLSTTWRHLEGQWMLSAPLDEITLSRLRRKMGLEPAGGTRLVDLTFGGGVRTDRCTWLGRPGFLPSIHASLSSAVNVRRVEGADGVVAIEGCPPSWQFRAETPISGRWRVKAVEREFETEKVVRFEAVAPERLGFPEAPAVQEAEREVVVMQRSIRPILATSVGVAGPPPPLEDMLEAIYAGPIHGWSEADLVRLLRPQLPHDHFVWDFLRGLAEAGWLEPYTLKSWRARIWRLRSPYLRYAEGGRVIAGGALGTLARRRLQDAAQLLGGEVSYLPGVSNWSVSLPVIDKVVAADLARETGWPLEVLGRPTLSPAPRCWPEEPRSGEGRQLAGVWSFDAGVFASPNRARANDPVCLERLVRERGDDRDIYRVVGKGEVFLSSSRTTAVLEAHRRLGKPLFEWEMGEFRRRGLTGHLPLELSRWLVTCTSRASGPLPLAGGGWTYVYPCDTETAAWVASTLGDAVSVPSNAPSRDLLNRAVEQRRLGRRLAWYEVPHP